MKKKLKKRSKVIVIHEEYTDGSFSISVNSGSSTLFTALGMLRYAEQKVSLHALSFATTTE